MPHESIIARLDTVALLKTVGGSGDFAGIETAPKALPAAYVLPSSDKSGPNALASGGVEQLSSVRFSVAICVRNIKNPNGQSKQGELKSVRAAIDDVLLGWEPLTGYDLITHESGMVLKIGKGVLWWMDNYNTGYLRRK